MTLFFLMNLDFAASGVDGGAGGTGNGGRMMMMGIGSLLLALITK